MAFTAQQIMDGGGSGGVEAPDESAVQDGSMPEGGTPRDASASSGQRNKDEIRVDFVGHADLRAHFEEMNADRAERGLDPVVPAWMEAENLIMEAMKENGDMKEDDSLETAAELFGSPTYVSASEMGIEMPDDSLEMDAIPGSGVAPDENYAPEGGLGGTDPADEFSSTDASDVLSASTGMTAAQEAISKAQASVSFGGLAGMVATGAKAAMEQLKAHASTYSDPEPEPEDTNDLGEEIEDDGVIEEPEL